MTSGNALSRERIEAGVISLLQEMVRDWDLELDEPISSTTTIIDDLGFESIDLIQLMVGVEQAFSVRGLPYEEVLMKKGGYVTEITVAELVDFLFKHISGHQGSQALAS